MHESAWIAATLAGDTDAFAEIVTTYERAVFNLAYRMLGDREEAVDAAQESFLRAYAQLASYDGRRSFANWLLAIAAHYCIDVLRKRRPGRVELVDAEIKQDTQPPPEDVVLAGERREEVRLLLDRLPPAYRLTIVLRYWYDMSCEEIARVSGQSVGAVKTRLHRARALLAKTIEDGSIARQATAGNREGGLPACRDNQGEDDRALQRSAQAALITPGRPDRIAKAAGAGAAPFNVRPLPTV